ncbi:MAG: hypothetical protein M1114_01875 [Candidatus Dependentiae bacterium]|nr:hypothetical protein [Candidatus Dependentiae bacterium]
MKCIGKNILVMMAFLASLYFHMACVAKAGKIILESPIIRLIDGLGIINGNRIGSMLQVRREVRRIKLGEPQEGGEFVGLYEWNGKKYSVKGLAELEKMMQDANDAAGLRSLKPLLKDAKKDFIRWVMVFLGESEGAKGQMFLLIEEWSIKAKRHDSLLLRWAAAPAGEEERQFEKDIANFKIFDTFCTDLINFLEALMDSCPKAKAQFQEILRKQGYKGHSNI